MHVLVKLNVLRLEQRQRIRVHVVVGEIRPVEHNGRRLQAQS